MSDPILLESTRPNHAIAFFLHSGSIGTSFRINGDHLTEWKTRLRTWNKRQGFVPRKETAGRFGKLGSDTKVSIESVIPGEEVPNSGILTLPERVCPTEAQILERETHMLELVKDMAMSLEDTSISGQSRMDGREVYEGCLFQGPSITVSANRGSQSESGATQVRVIMRRLMLCSLDRFPTLGHSLIVKILREDSSVSPGEETWWTIRNLLQDQSCTRLELRAGDDGADWTGEWEGLWHRASFFGMDSRGEGIVTLGVIRLQATMTPRRRLGVTLQGEHDLVTFNVNSRLRDFRRMVLDAGSKVLDAALMLDRVESHPAGYTFKSLKLSDNHQGTVIPRFTLTGQKRFVKTGTSMYGLDIAVQWITGNEKDVNKLVEG